jgi:NAD(P)-dependent dehydrogenase (short-subunit alcohol dehydrogenase family)
MTKIRARKQQKGLSLSVDTSEGRGRLALVTGGASGIGAVTCEILSARGWGVVVADIDAPAAERVAAHCRGHSVAMNVMDAASIALAAASIESRLGSIYGLVNCAALFAPQTPPEQLGIDTWDRITSTNLRGTYICNVEFGKRMASRGEGAIVNISSIGGHRPNHGHAYTTSKAGILALTQGMAGEWGRSGVRVNSITPGFVGVPRMLAAIELGKRYPVPPASLSALGRLVRPEEVAESIAFLLSDRASAITGTDLAVDAGVLATSGWVVHGGPPPARPAS